jgi:AAA+ ATPase superfamily predicted ATPase
MKFINRTKELNALERLWEEGRPQLIIIYGKRRIGKTELIKQFIKKKSAIYFLSKRVSEKENLFSLANIIGRTFGDDFLVRKGFSNWDEVFTYLKGKIGTRIILIVDEFPYLAEANKGISSVFQAGWDQFLKDLSIYLILCGSSIAMMESETLAHKAPLYGRRTAQIFVKPMSFSEAEKFFPKIRFNEGLAYYTIAGGNPAYLQKLVPYDNLEEIVKKQILTPEQFLYEEVDFILKQELREPRNYMSILKAIAFSKNKVSEIVNETGFEKSILHKYLFILEDLQLIEKEVPVTEKNPQKSRRGLYKLQDEFLRFWFTYVYPFKSELELGNMSLALSKFRKSFHILVAQEYEKVSREIIRFYQDDIFLFQKVGRWWYKDKEIDMVSLNEEENKILFGEIKWSNKPVGTNIYRELKEKAKVVEWGKRRRQEYFCLFSKSGFTPEMKKVARKEGIFLFQGNKLIMKKGPE